MPGQEELEFEFGLQGKSLSEKLKEMGFDERSFLSVKNGAKVGDIGFDGTLKENPYKSFGPEHVSPSAKWGMNDRAVNDDFIGNAIGGIGSNNGLYSAQVRGKSECIITQDPKIYEALQKLGFKEGLGVPMSNGGKFMDADMQMNFEHMKSFCARAEDQKGQEKRTAAVQRGDIITTYDPESKGNDGVYKNVRHYQKSQDGSLRSISMYEASHILQPRIQYNANAQAGISKGEQLDKAVVQQMIRNGNVRY